MNNLTTLIPASLFLISFFYLLIYGLILRKNKIGLIGKTVFKARFCSLTNLKTGQSSSFMSKVVITDKYVYFLTTILFYTIGDTIGLLKKIPIEQIKEASIRLTSNKKHERIYIELVSGEKFILKCSNQVNLLNHLEKARRNIDSQNGKSSTLP